MFLIVAASTFLVALIIVLNKFIYPRFKIGQRIIAYYFTGEAQRGVVAEVNDTIIKFHSDKGHLHTAHIYQCRKEK